MERIALHWNNLCKLRVGNFLWMMIFKIQMAHWVSIIDHQPSMSVKCHWELHSNSKWSWSLLNTPPLSQKEITRLQSHMPCNPKGGSLSRTRNKHDHLHWAKEGICLRTPLVNSSSSGGHQYVVGVPTAWIWPQSTTPTTSSKIDFGKQTQQPPCWLMM